MVGSVAWGTLLVRPSLSTSSTFLLLKVIKILGSCFFGAGYGKDIVRFDVDMTRIMSSLMVVSSAPFIVPSVLYSTSTPKSLETSDHILVLSYSTSIILLIFYSYIFIFSPTPMPIISAVGTRWMWMKVLRLDLGPPSLSS
jgi:Ca2+/H+ antiporter